jgi:lipopolysaccharide/colanic/teichoic acid biosynthesis glycosyltransferase
VIAFIISPAKGGGGTVNLAIPRGLYVGNCVSEDLPQRIHSALLAACPDKAGAAHVSSYISAALIRLMEILVAVMALIATFPVMVLVAMIVRMDSPGAVLFRQIRVGRNGRLFVFYKFRTFWADARKLYPGLYAYRYSAQEIEQLQFKREDDPRVTPAGYWLRKSTLDELPNLWNLLKGDVALVGPRPEIPEMLPYYRPEQMIKFSVKPGITGLAQTMGRGRLRFNQTNDYDVQYVKSKSFALDCRIICRTIRLMVTRDGAF